MNTKEGKGSFEEEARRDRHGILAESWDFLMHTKKWWLLPIFLLLFLLGLLIVLASSGAGAFIYTVF